MSEIENRTLAEYISLKESYIDGFVPILNAFQDFDKIDYAWSIKDQTEYVRISDTISEPAFFDVSGLSRSEIASELFKYFSGMGTDRLVTESEDKRRIVRLFKEARS